MNASHTPAPRTAALVALAALGLLAGSTHALAQAPQLVRNINPRNSADFGSSPNGLFTLGNRVLFTATSREHGSELWTTDGTAAGTTLLKDIQPGPIGSQPRLLARVGQRVLLTAGNIALGEEVWVTDGTPEGTIPLGDFAAGRIGSAPGNPIVIDGVVHFSARVGTPASPSSPADTLPFRLVSTDSTPAGTVNLGDGLSNPIQIGRRVIFAGADPAGTTGVELFALDLDTGTRTLVANIFPSAGSSDPIARASLPSRALYSALFTRLPERRALTASGGTTDSTEFLLTFTTDLSGDAIEIAVIGDRAILSRAGSAAGGKLWITDGTRAGTAQLIDLLPGSVNGPLPANLTAWNNQLAFTLATDASGPQIWLINPATAAVQRLTTLNNTPGSGGPSQLTVVNNRLYFTADTPDAGREAWVVDDTPFGASMLPELTPGPASSSPQAFTALVSTRVLYTALVPGSGQELVVTDGNPAGTGLVRNIGSNLGGSSGGQLTAAAGRLYFTAILPETGLEPHRSDGTTAGTSLIGDLVPGPARSFVRSIVTNNDDAAILWQDNAEIAFTGSNLLIDNAAIPPRQFTLPNSGRPANVAFAVLC